MAIFIGVDEAGYGPNYGPLCVAASAWRVEEKGDGGGRKAEGGRGTGDGKRGTVGLAVAKPRATVARKKASGVPDLYKLLRKAVARAPDKAGRRIAIADSKALYTAGLGLRQLERGVLAAMRVLEHEIATALDLISAMAADPEGRRHRLACHAGDDDGLPLEVAADELAAAVMLLQGACSNSGVSLVALRARLVYPCEFNALCGELGTKGAALSHATLALVRQVIDSLPAADCSTPIVILLDKHGGRSRYAALVQHHFPECWIDVIAEARAESRYVWEHGGRRVEAAFRVACEEFLPTALASMTAKYQRELAMRAFNAFWTSRVPGLRPTAGYPSDSGRFRKAISGVQAELGILDRDVWRSR